MSFQAHEMLCVLEDENQLYYIFLWSSFASKCEEKKIYNVNQTHYHIFFQHHTQDFSLDSERGGGGY